MCGTRNARWQLLYLGLLVGELHIHRVDTRSIHLGSDLLFAEGVTSPTVYASATILPSVSLQWQASTSTPVNLLPVAQSGTVQWGTGGLFDQSYTSTGATSCSILVYGFWGGSLGDPDNVSRNPYTPWALGTPILWDSNATWGPLPAAYVFEQQHFEPPLIFPPQTVPFDGYKWYLTCGNAYQSKTIWMYGVR